MGTIINIWNTVWPILVAIVLFGMLVVIHELGHFIYAKLFKVRVNEFSIGFGPAIFKKQKGETLYAVRIIPFGGYCAMEGEDEDSDDPSAFGKKKVWKRMIIVAAGAIHNMILGLLLVGIMLSIAGQFSTTQVADFYIENAPSNQTGLQKGDTILSVDGRNVYCASDLSYMLMVSEDTTLTMEVERNGQEVLLENVQFASREIDGKRYIAMDFQVQAEEMTITKPLSFIENTVKESVSIGRVVWMSLVDLVGGRYGLNEMMGPVGVVSTVSETVSDAVSGDENGVNFEYLLYLMAMLSINLGIVNLLPLPALDGGRLVFLLYEAIFRKPIPAKYEGWVHGIGLALLLCLILVITGNDIIRLFQGG